LTLAGAEIPSDRPYDGYDLSPLLRKGSPSPRREVFYYRGGFLLAMRVGPLKVHWITQTGYGAPPELHDPPLQFMIDQDPGETRPLEKVDENALRELEDRLAVHRRDLRIVTSLLD
jgi:hypothetical protein